MVGRARAQASVSVAQKHGRVVKYDEKCEEMGKGAGGAAERVNIGHWSASAWV